MNEELKQVNDGGVSYGGGLGNVQANQSRESNTEFLNGMNVQRSNDNGQWVTDKVGENFHIFGIAAFIYACFYAFCMFKNSSGITCILCTVGSIFFIRYWFGKLDVKLKKGSIFYIVSMLLISVSTFCTDDGRIISFNKLGMLLLVLCFLLDVVYDTRKWQLVKFISSIATVCVMAFGEICSPFQSAVWYFRNKWDKRNYKYVYLLLGIAIAVPLFVVVFLLLFSADAVFRNITGNFIEGLNLGNMFLLVLTIVFVFMASYCVMSFMSRKNLPEEVCDTKRCEPLIAIPIAGIMTMLYLVFSVIQIVYLFMGNMNLPNGYTYAEYAREGFFQLLAVSILNLIMVLVGLGFFRDSRRLKCILAVMSFCTIIMIASSAMRMIIYIQYYYLTFLRIMVLWCLAVLLLIFMGVIVSIFRQSFPLFRYSMVVVTVLYMCLAFSHPDYIIAKVNLAGTEADDSTFFKGEAYNDFYVISELCADAAPAVAEWMETDSYRENKEFSGIYGSVMNYTYQCVNSYIDYVNDSAKDMGLRSFNISRYMAVKYLEDAKNY